MGNFFKISFFIFLFWEFLAAQKPPLELECEQVKINPTYIAPECTFVDIFADNQTEFIVKRRMTAVHPDFPRNVNYFYFAEFVDSRVAVVPKPILDTFRNLKSLKMERTFVQGFKPLTFDKASALLELRLAYNLISHVDNDTFFGASRLEILDLSNNLLTTIHPNAFAETHRLRQLLLHSNFLATLSLEFFAPAPVAFVDASNNRLESVSLISHFDPAPQVTRFKPITSLDLSVNRLQNLTVNYPLGWLWIGSNGINDLSFNRLLNVSSVSNLYLDDNELERLNETSLELLVSGLTGISLARNHWKCEELVDLVLTLEDKEIALLHEEGGIVGVKGRNFRGLECQDRIDEDGTGKTFEDLNKQVQELRSEVYNMQLNLAGLKQTLNRVSAVILKALPEEYQEEEQVGNALG